MERRVIKAAPRSETGSSAARRLRRGGRVPAVLYGHKRDNINMSVDPKDLRDTLDHGVYMVALDIDGTSETALIKKIQYDTMQEHIVHADFTRVALDEKIRMAVPVETTGVPKGERAGGVMDIVMKEVSIECLPDDIPDAVHVKVADLDVADRVLVSDLEVPETVQILEPEGSTVVVIHPPVVRVEEEVEVEEGPAEPEVIAEREEKAQEETGGEG